MPKTLGRRVETGSGRVGNTPRESKIPRKEGRKGTLRVERMSATPETNEITPASVETDREGRKPPNRTDTRTFVLHEPKIAPPTLPKPEILPQNDLPHLSNDRNTHPTNNHTVNDHLWNDHQVKNNPQTRSPPPRPQDSGRRRGRLPRTGAAAAG